MKTFANIINYYSLILLTMRKTLLHFCTLLVAFVAWGATACAANQLTVTYLAANKAEVTRASSSDPFMVPVDVSFLNLTTEPLTMQVGIGYYDADDRLVLSTPLVTQTFEPNMGFGQDGMTVPLGQGLADGTYQVKLVNRVGETMPWMPMDRSEQYYLEMEIAGTTAQLINHADGEEEAYHLEVNFVVEGCVGNPDTGYEVEGNTLKGVVRITNDGNHDYDKSIAYKLYRQEGSGRVEVENYSRPLELKVGDATEVPFEFDGLDHTYAYTLAVSYYVSEDKMSDEITFGPLHLKEVETFSLDVDFKIENCTGDETTGYEVTGNKIKGVMVVANQSGHDYADEFSCTLYDGTERVPFTTSIEVKAGETIEVPFEFDNLNYEGEYMLYVGYCYEEGSMMDFFIFGPFTLIDPATGIEGVEVDGEAEADQPVYNLQGVRMPDGASLPKGIYIRGGKKFVVK